MTMSARTHRVTIDRLVVELGSAAADLKVDEGHSPTNTWHSAASEAVESAQHLVSRIVRDPALIDLGTVSRAWAYIASAQHMIARAKEARAQARVGSAQAAHMAAEARRQAARSLLRAERFSRWHQRYR